MKGGDLLLLNRVFVRGPKRDLDRKNRRAVGVVRRALVVERRTVAHDVPREGFTFLPADEKTAFCLETFARKGLDRGAGQLVKRNRGGWGGDLFHLFLPLILFSGHEAFFPLKKMSYATAWLPGFWIWSWFREVVMLQLCVGLQSVKKPPGGTRRFR